LKYEILLEWTKLLESGEEPGDFYRQVLKSLTDALNIEEAAILLPSEKDHIEPITYTKEFHSTCLTSKTTESYHSFDITSFGAIVGALAVIRHSPFSTEENAVLKSCASLIGFQYERFKTGVNSQLLHDRLQVLNELNQLNARNVSIDRITKTISREGAFRFSADASLLFLSESDDMLVLNGAYGCNSVEQTFGVDDGILGQVLRVGGHLSVPTNQAQGDPTLQFMCDLGLDTVDACALEIRGETLGVLVLGFRRKHGIASQDLTRFEEFCQGAAVALANSKAQSRLTKYTERLEELVAERTQDLAVQTARAEEANQAKSRFLANMSHELRTPLTAIVGYSSVLADGIFGPLNEQQLDGLNAITRSSEHLKNLIDDVLNLARVESGKEAPEPKRVAVKDALTAPYKLILQQAINKKVKVRELVIPENLADRGIYADPKHLQQIILNILSNSVKYTPEEGEVWLEVSLNVDKIKIEIHDTGVGISKEKQAKLFERFERGEDSYSLSQEGTGIGLNLTKHLVEINGGRIGVESEIGRGSTFWIMMPLAQGDPVQITKEEKETTRVRLDGLKALVVDDNQATVEVLVHVLKAAGASVESADSVLSAKERLCASVPDIILTDIAMPGESGLALVDYVRNEKALSVPIIVLSACAFQSDEDAAVEAGASLFIPKPFKPNDVIRSVRSLTLQGALNKNA